MNSKIPADTNADARRYTIDPFHLLHQNPVKSDIPKQMFQFQPNQPSKMSPQIQTPEYAYERGIMVCTANKNRENLSKITDGQED